MTSMAKPDTSEAPHTTSAHQTLLTDQLLTGLAARARRYDEQNTFFAEDFQELREAGYLRLAVPAEFGGFGLTLAEVVREQRRLAYHAPPPRSRSTCTCTGRAWPPTSGAPATSRSSGCSRRRRAAQVFAAGHAESGNDIPVLLSTTKAERVDGGYRFTGRKRFGSLTPGLDVPRASTGWTRAIRRSRRSCTRSCRATRRATESKRPGTCSACAPRAATTRSSTAPSSPIATLRGWCPRERPAWIDFVLGVFAWALTRIRQHLLRARAQRAGSHRRDREEQAVDRRSRARWPTTRRCSTALPRWVLALESIEPHLERDRRRLVGRRRTTGPRGRRRSWRRSTTRWRTAWRIVDQALDVAGGFGIFRAEPDGAAVPRRPARPDSPGELDADARDHGQDASRHQPRRNAQMGLAASVAVGLVERQWLVPNH